MANNSIKGSQEQIPPNTKLKDNLKDLNLLPDEDLKKWIQQWKYNTDDIDNVFNVYEGIDFRYEYGVQGTDPRPYTYYGQLKNGIPHGIGLKQFWTHSEYGMFVYGTLVKGYQSNDDQATVRPGYESPDNLTD